VVAATTALGQTKGCSLLLYFFSAPKGWQLMTIDQLVFVGLNGYVVALNRETGEIVWSNNELKSGYVTILVDGDRLIVSTNGFIYSLDPLTGSILWNNPMKGYGMGTPTALASVRGQSPDWLIQQAAAVATQTANS
jgi:outer membrane protein assembly factor BamB